MAVIGVRLREAYSRLRASSPLLAGRSSRTEKGPVCRAGHKSSARGVGAAEQPGDQDAEVLVGAYPPASPRRPPAQIPRTAPASPARPALCPVGGSLVPASADRDQFSPARTLVRRLFSRIGTVTFGLNEHPALAVRMSAGQNRSLCIVGHRSPFLEMASPSGSARPRPHRPGQQSATHSGPPASDAHSASCRPIPPRKSYRLWYVGPGPRPVSSRIGRGSWHGLPASRSPFVG